MSPRTITLAAREPMCLKSASPITAVIEQNSDKQKWEALISSQQPKYEERIKNLNQSVKYQS
jgi:hypothetical protein